MKRIPILVFLGLIAVDQFAKYISRLYFDGGFYVCNEGVGFGIKIPEIIFSPLWIASVIFLAYLFLNEKKDFLRFISCILILSGAVSNAIDRIFFGCVTDFIDLKFWPVFNLADVFIVIGAAGIAYGLYKKSSISRG